MKITDTQNPQIIIMAKNQETGQIEEEFCTIQTIEYGEYLPYLSNIFATYEEEKTIINVLLSTNYDVEDWEFDAIYDYYDTESFFENKSIENGIEDFNITEIEDVDNPTWRATFVAEDDTTSISKHVGIILRQHVEEFKDTKKALVEENAKEQYQ